MGYQRHALIKDKDSSSFLKLKNYLLKCNCRVLFVESAAQAKLLVENNEGEFDFFIVEIDDMDIECLESLVKKLRIIVLLPELNINLVNNGAIVGACYFLVRPVCYENLINMFRYIDNQQETKQITYGLVLKLAHVRKKIMLYSDDVPYGSGSGQQAVTAAIFGPDHCSNSYWIVRPEPGTTVKKGDPIKSETIIRLQHMQTRKWLHSHKHASPITGNLEVSCFGDDSESDSGDYWRLLIEGSGEMTWELHQKIRLQHVDTGGFLHSQIAGGQHEVCGVLEESADNIWQAEKAGVKEPVLKTSDSDADPSSLLPVSCSGDDSESDILDLAREFLKEHGVTREQALQIGFQQVDTDGNLHSHEKQTLQIAMGQEEVSCSGGNVESDIPDYLRNQLQGSRKTLEQDEEIGFQHLDTGVSESNTENYWGLFWKGSGKPLEEDLRLFEQHQNDAGPLNPGPLENDSPWELFPSVPSDLAALPEGPVLSTTSLLSLGSNSDSDS